MRMEVAQIEINVRRLLHRIQGALANTSHASSSEEEILKRWTYVDYAQNLIKQLHSSATSDDDSRRIENYEQKLQFIMQMMLSSEGHRPSMLTTSPPAQNVTTTTGDIDAKLKRDVISAEEKRTRSELLGKMTNHNKNKRGGLETDAELRRRLGLSDIPKTKVESNVDIANQLAKDEKLRDDIADDVLSLLETFRENTLNVQRSLKNDASRIEIADDLISRNRENVQKEIARVDTLYRQTAFSCYANCALVSTVLTIWIAVYIIMKITPSPR